MGKLALILISSSVGFAAGAVLVTATFLNMSAEEFVAFKEGFEQGRRERRGDYSGATYGYEN